MMEDHESLRPVQVVTPVQSVQGVEGGQHIRIQKTGDRMKSEVGASEVGGLKPELQNLRDQSHSKRQSLGDQHKPEPHPPTPLRQDL
jgi:hypothetical protein